METTEKGFIGLALQNQELLELNAIKEEGQEKEARANRKPLPKPYPMTGHISKELKGPT